MATWGNMDRAFRKKQLLLEKNLTSLENDSRYVVEDVQSACYLDGDIFPFFVSRWPSGLLQDLKTDKLPELAVSCLLLLLGAADKLDLLSSPKGKNLTASNQVTRRTKLQGPARPIHFPGKSWLIVRLAINEKCAGQPSCWSHMTWRVASGTSSRSFGSAFSKNWEYKFPFKVWLKK